MVFVPRLLSRRNNRKVKSRSRSRSRSKDKRRVQGNYRIKARHKRMKSDGGGEKEKWIIYSLKGCPYCSAAEDLLKKNGKTVNTVDFFKLDKSSQDKIEKMIKASDPEFGMTFPRIFCLKSNNKQFIGGYTNLTKIMN